MLRLTGCTTLTTVVGPFEFVFILHVFFHWKTKCNHNSFSSVFSFLIFTFIFLCVELFTACTYSTSGMFLFGLIGWSWWTPGDTLGSIP